MIAFTNPGGIRADITRPDDGSVTYGDVFAAQPFRNQLVTLTLDRRSRSRRCWSSNGHDPSRPRILQVSKGFSYAWDNTAAAGQRVLARAHDAGGQGDRSHGAIIASP